MDKILLKEHHISNPFSYAFYGGIWGGLACILIPFASFFVPSVSVLLLAFLSGGASIAALMFFYSAMKEGEPSRISTLLGGLSPVFVFFLSFLFFGTFIEGFDLVAFFILILGGVIVTYEPHQHSGRRRSTRIALVVLAAFCFALTYVSARAVFNSTPFLTGFIWTRFGACVASLLLLLHPSLRKNIFSWSPRRSSHTSGLFVTNKLAAAGGFFLLSYSISLIPFASPEKVSIVNAMQGIEYVFVFLLALFLSVSYPAVISEHIDAKTILLKITAVLCVAGGLILLAFGS